MLRHCRPLASACRRESVCFRSHHECKWLPWGSVERRLVWCSVVCGVVQCVIDIALVWLSACVRHTHTHTQATPYIDKTHYNTHIHTRTYTHIHYTPKRFEKVETERAIADLPRQRRREAPPQALDALPRVCFPEAVQEPAVLHAAAAGLHLQAHFRHVGW
jgi:hypothetical protein